MGLGDRDWGLVSEGSRDGHTEIHHAETRRSRRLDRAAAAVSLRSAVCSEVLPALMERRYRVRVSGWPDDWAA